MDKKRLQELAGIQLNESLASVEKKWKAQLDEPLNDGEDLIIIRDIANSVANPKEAVTAIEMIIELIDREG